MKPFSTFSVLNRPYADSAYEDSVVVFLPLFHIYGLFCLSLYTLYNGSAVIMMPKFGMEEYLNNVVKYKVQYNVSLLQYPPFYLHVLL